MEWKVFNLDKTVETTLTSDSELEELLQQVSQSAVDTGEPMVAYYYYNEGLFESLSTAYAGSPTLAKVLANDEHYARFLIEQGI